MFVLRCIECGKDFISDEDGRAKCTDCRELENKEINALNKQIAILTRQKRLRSAKRIIGELYGTYQGYETFLSELEASIDRPRWFGSVIEILAAMEIARSGIKYDYQVPIGRSRVDFILPDLKIVLEIDGIYHINRKDKDFARDKKIIKHLGPEWEVIRIEDELVKSNLKKLVPAIMKIMEQRKKEREQVKLKIQALEKRFKVK
ncbi:MAG: hypothetical protein A4E55_00381 [Pelotomaculum sp. PtaU1.Bin035]|nr:MAG: hypothetical protein A4E55_00381 [Pelotomaculum sp. PtaU1.Bin035]